MPHPDWSCEFGAAFNAFLDLLTDKQRETIKAEFVRSRSLDRPAMRSCFDEVKDKLSEEHRKSMQDEFVASERYRARLESDLAISQAHDANLEAELARSRARTTRLEADLARNRAQTAEIRAELARGQVIEDVD